MRIAKAVAMAAMGMISLTAPAAAQHEGAWLGVGTRTLAAGSGSQAFEVRGITVPRQIMFCVDGGPVRLVSAEIRYRNGDTRTLPVRNRVRAGGCSPQIALGNRDAELGAVTVTFDPASLAGTTPSLQVLVR